eukprot:4911241-Amphidinium_carterae.1
MAPCVPALFYADAVRQPSKLRRMKKQCNECHLNLPDNLFLVTPKHSPKRGKVGCTSLESVVQQIATETTELVQLPTPAM